MRVDLVEISDAGMEKLMKDAWDGKLEAIKLLNELKEKEDQRKFRRDLLNGEV